MSTHGNRGDYRAGRTAAPSSARPGMKQTVVGSTGPEFEAGTPDATMDAAAFSDLAVTEFKQRGQRRGNEAQAEERPSLAKEAKHADVIAQDTVRNLVEDKGFRAVVGGAEVHSRMQKLTTPKIEVAIDPARDGTRDDIREHLGRVFAGQSAQSIARFATVYDGTSGASKAIKPEAGIAKDSEKMMDWLADQASSGKSLQVRSTNLEEAALMSAKLAGTAGTLRVGQGIDMREVALQKAVDGVERELLGVNGTQNKSLAESGLNLDGKYVTEKSETLKGLASFGSKVTRTQATAGERSDVQHDQVTSQFLAAAGGSVYEESRLGLWKDVFYPTGKPVATVMLEAKKPAELEGAARPLIAPEMASEPEGDFVTVDIIAAKKPVNATTPQGSRDAQPEGQADPMTASPASAASASVSADALAVTADNAAVKPQAESLPQALTHIGRVSKAQGIGPVIEMANNEKLSGRLHLVGEQPAQVWFEGGSIRGIGSRNASPEEAMEVLATTPFRKYGFVAGDQAPESAMLPKALSHQGVLLEMARIQDEKARSAVDPAKMVLQPLAEMSAVDPAKLEEQQFSEMRRGIIDAVMPTL